MSCANRAACTRQETQPNEHILVRAVARLEPGRPADSLREQPARRYSQRARKGKLQPCA